LIPFLRSQFNAAWSPAKYARFLALLEDRFGEPVPFPHSETPCFLTSELVERAARAGSELVYQLLDNPAYLAASQSAIPEAYRTPGDAPVPLFVQADFGLDAERNLKLVEIQGFPSLYGYQPVLAKTYREAYGINDRLSSFPGGLSLDDYKFLLKEAIVGKHNPENVALLEIDPTHQKTRHDFTATYDMLGIAIVDARAVVKRGNRLFYDRAGTLVPIERIYNRVIADELDRRQIKLPFDFRDDLQVEWAGHPNWFYQLSKFSLPFFHHPAAPPSFFLHDAPEIQDLESYVLKPLYSFAGSGVVIGPTRKDIESIPAEQRSNYLLQQRVNFSPCIDTPDGPTKIEIRVMYIWLIDLKPVNLVIRMGRGAQMGVDHNKGLGWVGASAAFIYSGENQ
jgi:hypothetical protein